MTFYELRDGPDDPQPRGPYYDVNKAVAAGKRLSARGVWPVLLYRVSDQGERYLSEIEA